MGKGEVMNEKKTKKKKNKFPLSPPFGNMTRKHRMDRLKERLIEQGLYVHPICLDETHSEWGYFIVAVDNPYEV